MERDVSEMRTEEAGVSTGKQDPMKRWKQEAEI